MSARESADESKIRLAQGAEDSLTNLMITELVELSCAAAIDLYAHCQILGGPI